MERRDLLKSLAALPVAGAFGFEWFRKRNYEKFLTENIRNELNISTDTPEYKPVSKDDKLIRIGLIGFGIRGKQLAQAAGFVHPTTIDDWKKGALEDKEDTRYEDFLQQDALNIKISGVCDIFDSYGKMAQEAAANALRQGSGSKLNELPKRYRTYQELLASPDIDAVIIAAPDHWHGPLTIAAAKAGKHVYCEKPMTWTVPETYEVRRAVKENNIVFQLGHQGRQNESYMKAKEIIEKGVLGKVNLIEVTTNRNDPNGAWVYPIPPEASPANIDWNQFIGQAPYHDFSLERFFRWRCWWDYSTGLSGDLLTHEYDAMNQILGLGIPHSAASSGGIYFFKDGRTVPDVLQTVFEYPDRDLSLVYSATLASNLSRGRKIMGHDAYMELNNSVTVYADSGSTRYKEKIDKGIIDPDLPIYTYTPGMKNVDAITSPTSQYFAGRGLMYSYRSGRRINTTHLHIREWLDAIRYGTKTSCNIEVAFEEAMTAHMGTTAFKENRNVFWDPVKEIII
ncbi:MAG TPA: Gfo/Idh/MocA family oxidoreductase [Bacteroidales bacterium]|nr:Gfo/Idh/MocA family oxidoreductase [Bacteroidales bacterium]HPT01548.1 Gfo/Idh/MocA family oxidoreductase [Bacteroidales bacterium]